MDTLWSVSFLGSSPHTRGALIFSRCNGRDRGIIPAYAGSTSHLRSFMNSSWDHPRIRGEHESVKGKAVHQAGSSPHTRGALHFLDGEVYSAGIIPAYAGSTPRLAPHSRLGWDHPRIRGEHFPELFVRKRHKGSSPHTRGAHIPRSPLLSPSWIIPAYAGSTDSGHRTDRIRRDHPRIRGEHWQAERGLHKIKGSSPHTRGALFASQPKIAVSGIIPAYAGSTCHALTHPPPRRDHPRIRGEHRLEHVRSEGKMGSSPHTRGALPRSSFRCQSWGIIPAYAGSTQSSRRFFRASQDHPRIRGEHPSFRNPPNITVGSSPHTRGAPIRT